MSEAPKEAKEGAAPAKKKGKLPIILALVLLLGGGGFFAMKSKSGGPKKVEVKVGTVEALDKEFLVNLANPNVYLRAELSVQLRDGFKKEDLDASMPEVRDCVNQIFRSKRLEQVGASQTEPLQKEIAMAINKILIGHMKEEEKKAQAEFEKATASADTKQDKKDDGGDGKSDETKDSKTKPKDEDKIVWPCPAGPVLGVFFTSFTTQ